MIVVSIDTSKNKSLALQIYECLQHYILQLEILTCWMGGLFIFYGIQLGKYGREEVK